MTVTIGVSMPPQHGDMPQLRKAWEEADRLGCPTAVCYDYLTNVMDYDLGDRHHQALSLFGQKCRALALV